MAFSKEEALHFLQKATTEDRLGHAYLISGNLHAGARLLSEEVAALVLGCGPLHVLTHPDFHQIAPESKSRKILTEQIRKLEEELHLKSQISSYKVAVIEDADRMVPAAANAFLKTLEEPPERTLLLLLTTLPEALLETIRSRCILLSIHSKEERPIEEKEKKVTLLMEKFFAPGAPTDATAAFQLARSFQALLGEAREEALNAAEEEFNAEKKHYSKTTEGNWENQRDEYFKASSEATALEQRTFLLGSLADYFGARLRAVYKENHEQKMSENETKCLLRSLDSIESLRRSLEQGIQEALALEAGFLELMQNYQGNCS